MLAWILEYQKETYFTFGQHVRTLAGGGGATALLAFLSLGLVPGAVNALMPGHNKRLLATYVAGSSDGMRSALLTAFVPVRSLILGAPRPWPRSPVRSSTSMLRLGSALLPTASWTWATRAR